MERSTEDAGKYYKILAINGCYIIVIIIMLVYSDNNDTWFEIGSYYSGFYRNNTNDNIPASSDVYYILNFNNILTSFGNINFHLSLHD